MQTKLAKYTISYLNEQEYHYLKNEIFTNNCYSFETDKEDPLIIDVGAHIGLSILYFKREYPNSRIVAFEPNPITVQVLNENIFNNNLDDIEIHESAIWVEDGIKKMYIDNTEQDRYSVASFNKNCWNGTVKSKLISVKTERLDKYVNQDIDLLKLDIEGAEQRVLKSIKRYFCNIKNIIFEYHPTHGQDIKKILELLDTHYDIRIYQNGKEIKKNIPNNKLLLVNATYKK
ncbi:FkbM family methyltransferase [bacterium]|nr:FkbM family methyltransferase [bacterium]